LLKSSKDHLELLMTKYVILL